MALRPLGLVKEIVESAGMGISYAYEDLVFMEHNAFLLQFTKDDKVVLIHFNKEADESELQEDIARLKDAASAHEMSFEAGTTYTITQADGENIRIEFFS